MAALPTTTVAFASGATEAQFKTFLADQRAFLVGLLGADGTAATAKATLGVATLTSAAISSALGYTPQASLGYTAARTGSDFSWVYVGTLAGASTNFYANWGAGIYAAPAFPASGAYAVSAEKTTTSSSTAYAWYKLTKV